MLVVRGVMQAFRAPCSVNGVKFVRGQRKLTWQVIADTTLYSYDVFANPSYNTTMQAMKDATNVRGKCPPVTAAFSVVVGG